LLAHCCCSLFTTCFNAVTHQISRKIVAFKQHIKAAMFLGGGALYAALFAAAEQVAGDTNGWHEVF